MIKRVICAILCASLLFLASCQGAGKGDGSQLDFSPVFDEVEGEKGGVVLDGTKINDLFDVCAKRGGKKYVVSSENFGVDEVCFQALFNLIISHQIESGDGDYDRYDEYISSGAIDPAKGVKGQTLPEGGMTWYADALGETVSVCFKVLRDLEFAKSRDVLLTERLSDAKIERELRRIREAGYDSDLEGMFGEGADSGSVTAAVMLYVLSGDTMALAIYEKDLVSFKTPEYTVAEKVEPRVAAAFGKDS